MGEEGLLQQIFTNLLDNALVHRRKNVFAPVLKRIPAVFLSSSSHERDVAMACDIVASYLMKLVSFNGLIEIVTRIEDYWLGFNVSPPGLQELP
ncbi:MAG: hypothetical protein HY661_12695 [Betaproteobacteria bacterium]|nr:hypothetical protein [Betaproteobacteria bacterium]